MSRGPYPIMLLLAMSLPGTVRALGLGDIRVDSALNEPLSAQIDIVGATRDELAALTAKVANREVFLRYGADRPAFLQSATFKVGIDAAGNPVLNVRSTESFTDPVVNLLVDLRWGRGELIREYSLLLDPANFFPARALAAAPGNAAPQAAAEVEAPATAAVRSPGQPAALPHAPRAEPVFTAQSQYRVVRGDTLRGIVRRAGARTESQAQRMMIAIFKGNPHAFEANINLLHLGALLTMPTPADVDAVDGSTARREVREQMTAWRMDGRPGIAAQGASAAPTTAPATAAPVAPAAAPTPAAPAVSVAATAAAAPAAPTSAASSAADEALKQRVQTLEKALDDLHQQLAAENAQLEELKKLAEREPVAAAAVPAVAAAPAAVAPVKVEVMQSPERSAPQAAPAAAPPSRSGVSPLLIGTLAGCLIILLGGFALLRRRVAAGARTAPQIPDGFADQARRNEEMAAARMYQAGRDAAVTTRAEPERAPTAAARSVEPTQSVAADIISEEITMRSEADSTSSLGIDTDLLERSYLDALGIDTTGPVPALTEDPNAATSPMKAVQVDVGATTGPVPALSEEDMLADTAKHQTAHMTTVGPQATSEETQLNTALFATVEMRSAAGKDLDYNLLDLDATQSQHVHMPSDLYEKAGVAERRMSIVEVLESALEKDPNRRDLLMKLLETHYATAGSNHRAFVDQVRKLSRESNTLSAEDWDRIVKMGREIAPLDPLFAEQPKTDDSSRLRLIRGGS